MSQVRVDDGRGSGSRAFRRINYARLGIHTASVPASLIKRSSPSQRWVVFVSDTMQVVAEEKKTTERKQRCV